MIEYVDVVSPPGQVHVVVGVAEPLERGEEALRRDRGASDSRPPALNDDRKIDTDPESNTSRDRLKLAGRAER